MIQHYRSFILPFLLFSFIANNSLSQSITNISPNSGNRGQSLAVSISGQNTSFSQDSSGAYGTSVWFSQGTSTLIYPGNITIINSSQLKADFIFPNSLPVGYYNVNVQDSSGKMIVSNGFFLNPNPNPPFLTSATPSVSITGKVLNVTISGQHTNFGQGTSTTNVWFSQGTSTLIYPDYVNIISPTQVNASFAIPYNAKLGNYNVNSNNAVDGHLTLANGFLINQNPNPPVLVSVTPSVSITGKVLNVTISGQHTNFGQGTSTTNVWFNQGTSTLIYSSDSVIVISPTQVIASFTIPYNAKLGKYNVNTNNAVDGQLTLVNGFQINQNPNPPVLVSATPSVSVTGKILTVTISGQHTNFGQGTSTTNVWFSQGTSTLIYSDYVNVISPTQVNARFTIPYNAKLGKYNVNTNEDVDGHLTLANGFLINQNPNPPILVSATPSVSVRGKTLTVTISGQNTNFGQGTATTSVWFSQGTSTLIYSSDSVQVISPAQINASFTIPYDAKLGKYNVNTSENLDGHLTLANGFLVNNCTFSLLTSQTNVLCNGGNTGSASANPLGGAYPYSFLWNPSGQTTPTAVNLSAGTYNIQVTDTSGCIGSASVAITQPTALVASAGPNKTVYYGYAPNACTLLKGQVTGGVLPYKYLWSTGATTSSVTVCPSTGKQYTLTITDVNGCTSTDVVKVCVVDVRAPGGKVMICHKSTNGSLSTMIVAASLVPGHLAHGDNLGKCGSTISCPDSPKTGEEEDLIIEDGINLSSYPNPFAHETTIRFNTAESGQAEVSIYNVLGIKIATLFKGIVKGSEIHEEKFNAQNLSSGIFFVELITEQGEKKVERLVLTKQ